MRKTVASLTLGATIALSAGCAGTPEASPEFCEAVEELAESRFVKGNYNRESSYSRELALKAADKLADEVEETAPPAIAKAMRKMYINDPDSLRISEQERHTEGRDQLNGFIREGCDLDFQF